jgi:hypothetical protein
MIIQTAHHIDQSVWLIDSAAEEIAQGRVHSITTTTDHNGTHCYYTVVSDTGRWYHDLTELQMGTNKDLLEAELAAQKAWWNSVMHKVASISVACP